MEEAVDELLEQLEVERRGRISFEHFMQCRMQFLVDLEQDNRISAPDPFLAVLGSPSSHGNGVYHKL